MVIYKDNLNINGDFRHHSPEIDETITYVVIMALSSDGSGRLAIGNDVRVDGSGISKARIERSQATTRRLGGTCSRFRGVYGRGCKPSSSC